MSAILHFRFPRFPLLLVLLGLPWGGTARAAETALAQVQRLTQASLLVTDAGRAALAQSPDTPRIPASTLKLLTAFAALETWGSDHRFVTPVYRTPDDWLWVRGLADPYLVSEELDRLAAALAAAGIRRVAGLGLDDSFFDPALEIAGRSDTDNPYDAPVTALAANFNTVQVTRDAEQVRSAEPQTPLTATARQLGAGVAPGTQRINLRTRATALRHFGELLTIKLRAAGIAVGAAPRIAPVPRGATPVLQYRNSRALAATIAPMLKFSNNFVANALFLHLAAPDGRGQVTRAGASDALTAFARARFGWREIRFDDGAGLSRANRLSARQLVELLEAFRPYQALLPVQEGTEGVRAKTGTLHGVSAYAGYARRRGRWEPFALLINEPVDAQLRLRVARELVR